MYRVLVNEPNAAIATAIRVVLEQNGFAVDIISEADDLRARDLESYAAIVIDAHREGRRGLDIIEWVHRTKGELLARVVVITGDDPEAIRAALRSQEVCEVVIKPVTIPEILRAVQECLEKNPAMALN